MKDPLDMQPRAIDALCAIGSLGKYLSVTEAQMEEVWHIERHTLESRPPARDGEEHEQRWHDLNHLDNLYEAELYPTMRYSFIVLLHIFTETRLRSFCLDIQSERHVPVGVAELKGSAIDQTRTFLTKLAGVGVQDFPEKQWENLRTLQKVRDCVVHAYGRVKDSRDETFLRQLASNASGVSIDQQGRLQVDKGFCERQVANLHSLFERLVEAVGWA